MEIILSESQYKVLIIESVKDSLKEKSEESKKFLGKIVDEVKNDVSIDLSFLLTWSTTIAGLMSPVHEFISGKYPELTSGQLSLITIGAILTFYFDSKKNLGEVIDKIKEEGLVEVFDEMLEKTYLLKDYFTKFIESLGVSITKLSNILAFTFLISVMNVIYESANSGFDESQQQILISGILSYLGTLTTKSAGRQIIKKMFKRFKV